MRSTRAKPGLRTIEVVAAWGNILRGRPPMLSIEITRECPLACPGCYAYGENHLGGEVRLRDLSDYRGDALVAGVIALVRQHRPLHVSLVGGEPLLRVRELSRILPELSRLGVVTMVVTSAVAPIPTQWMSLPRVRVAVSVDGLPEHHNPRRKPATYDRILRNIAGRSVSVHWTVTAPMLERPGYLEEFVSFWNARPEVSRIWVSVYTPQVGEYSNEMLSADQRRSLARELPPLRSKYPKLLINEGIAQAFLSPPRDPRGCVFSRMSVNYSADLNTRVEPCIFGGAPDCAQCGCSASAGLHWLTKVPLVAGVRLGHFVRFSIAVGSLMRRLQPRSSPETRWREARQFPQKRPLVQIST